MVRVRRFIRASPSGHPVWAGHPCHARPGIRTALSPGIQALSGRASGLCGVHNRASVSCRASGPWCSQPGIRAVVFTAGHPSHTRPGIWVSLPSYPGIQAVVGWASRLPGPGYRASGPSLAGHPPGVSRHLLPLGLTCRPARAVIPHGTPTALLQSAFLLTRTTPGPTAGSLGA